ncbi:GNAT family N-acetyltransferase [Sphingomonas sp.]|uniref:GNAT family N-acetyltransferase n=1 Tax=Sphingomonas sp. TaxID=28214 RepID=UPI003CC6BD1C
MSGAPAAVPGPWRIEHACQAAWPTAAETLIDGWLLRAGGGATRRLNSLNPIEHGPRDPAPVLAQARAMLAACRKPLTVRVPAIAVGLDTALDALGFGAPEDATLTLLAAPAAAAPDASVTMTSIATPRWLAARAVLAGLDRDGQDQLAAAVALLVTAAFATVTDGGIPVAAGYAALVDGVAVLEAIVTGAAHRRRGHARRLVAALQGWAAAQGAEAVCLQVAAANTPAHALYRGVGFTTELYRYHYRVVGADGLEPPTSSV